MSIIIEDGIGGQWNEDGIPTKQSNKQEPIQICKDAPKKLSYAQLESENQELRELFVYFFGENYQELEDE